MYLSYENFMGGNDQGKKMSQEAPQDNNEIMVEKHRSRYWQNNRLKRPAKIITIIILEITICC